MILKALQWRRKAAEPVPTSKTYYSVYLFRAIPLIVLSGIKGSFNLNMNDMAICR